MACDRLTPTAKCCRRFAAPPRPKKRNPRRARRGKELSTKGLEKAREGPAKDRQAEKEFPRKGKKISTKGHEERRRATKGLEEAREESAKGRKGGPRRDSKGLGKTRKGSVRGHEERHSGGKDLDLPGSAGVPPASGPRRRFRPRLRAREQTGNILYTINRKQGSVVSLLNDPPGRSGTRLTRISHRVAGYRLGKCFF